jgi:hypothetical protein
MRSSRSGQRPARVMRPCHQPVRKREDEGERDGRHRTGTAFGVLATSTPARVIASTSTLS